MRGSIFFSVDRKVGKFSIYYQSVLSLRKTNCCSMAGKVELTVLGVTLGGTSVFAILLLIFGTGLVATLIGDTTHFSNVTDIGFALIVIFVVLVLVLAVLIIRDRFFS